jgi:TonB family protein
MTSDFDWMKLTDVEKTSAGSVTIILESVQPQTIRPKNDPIASHQTFQYAILDRSAVNSVKTWSFTPARRGKDTVDMWVRVPVRFKLE